METLKQLIKQLAAGQPALKNQRKTIYFEGVRTLTPSQAFEQHRYNRYKLRLLNVAYGILKGKTVEEMEAKAETPINMAQVNKIVEKYTLEVAA